MRNNRSARDQRLFDRMANEYARKDTVISSAFARKHRLLSTIQSIGEDKKGTRVLEIGCGAGYSALYLKGYYKEYVGIDHSSQLIEYAKSKIEVNRDDVTFEYISIEDYRPTKCFDTIIAIGVLHHLSDPSAILIKIKNWMTDEGVIVINEPTSGNILVSILRFCRKIIDKNYSQDQKEFSPEELVHLFTIAGYQHIQCVPQGYLSTPFAEVILRPIFLFYPVAKLSVKIDRFIEKKFSMLFKRLSWNSIVVGRCK